MPPRPHAPVVSEDTAYGFFDDEPAAALATQRKQSVWIFRRHPASSPARAAADLGIWLLHEPPVQPATEEGYGFFTDVARPFRSADRFAGSGQQEGRQGYGFFKKIAPPPAQAANEQQNPGRRVH